MGTLVAILLCFLVGVTLAQQECRFQVTCNDCIQTPGCEWCSKFKLSAGDQRYHCLPTDTKTKTSDICAAGATENPRSERIIIDDLDFSESIGKSQKQLDSIVQLKPQQMKLKLRKGSPEKVKLTYKQVVGYPIDLYYLMDLSNSMEIHRDKLAELSGTLTATLRNLTWFYTIGFGSFVDKVMMPYVDMHPSKIDAPCTNCAKAYSFRNDMPLGDDGNLFENNVKKAQISGNLDAPEGGFDALMQVMVCDEAIKWRKQARRLVVFSTDAQFHQAGDGKLAGVVTPNDETCHLNSIGEYDAYDKYDYPSIGQINKVAKEKGINVIFAIAGSDGLYKELTKVIENSSSGQLDKKSDNVVTLVEQQYRKITSSVTLTDNSTDIISMEYSSSCKDSGDTITNTNRCNNIIEGDQVEFYLDVKLNKCPVGQKTEIVEVKTLQDKFILEIEFLCDCNCENSDDHNLPSSQCNNSGALVCGVCACFSGFHGDRCRCNADGGGTDKPEDILQCQDKDHSNVTCSDRGICVCGSCECLEEDISGKFCQCNTRKCLSNEGKICSDHGTCSCEECSCLSGYTGPVCECETDAACRDPVERNICSGHGECVCGKCVCETTDDESYTGTYCDHCLTCKASKCQEFSKGVLCRFHDPDPISKLCNLTVEFHESLDSEEEKGGRLCSVMDEEDDCMILFSYRYIDISKNYIIHVQEKKECPEPAPILGIVIGILLGIVVIGLLTLLLWKLLTSYHDRQEYAKFEKERQNPQWNTERNPLYKGATNTYANPVFSQQAQ